MKNKGNFLLKNLKIIAFVIVFMLSFGSNANAATNAPSMNLTSNTLTISAQNPTLTWGFGWYYKWKKKWYKKKKKQWHKKPKQPTDSVPLDGGLGVLLLGATAFGVRKLRKN